MNYDNNFLEMQEYGMVKVGDMFPEFSLTASPSIEHFNFKTISSKEVEGKWFVMFFYPKDFTFVCPTEMVDYGNIKKDLDTLNCELFGCSVDSEFVHANWKLHDKRLVDLPYDLLSDVKRELSAALGIIDYEAGVSQRATFIVDDKGIIRSIEVVDLSVGRNAQETLRKVQALQSGQLCPASWKKGDSFIKS